MSVTIAQFAFRKIRIIVKKILNVKERVSTGANQHQLVGQLEGFRCIIP